MDEKQPNRTATMITGFTMLLLTIMLIVFSEHGYHATVGALKLFFEVVFPSRLPFFILSDVLLSTGMVHYLGVWFGPLMRPIFNVPGVGSFVFSMGLAARVPDGCGAHGEIPQAGPLDQDGGRAPFGIFEQCGISIGITIGHSSSRFDCIFNGELARYCGIPKWAIRDSHQRCLQLFIERA